jgi:hypothetical protein
MQFRLNLLAAALLAAPAAAAQTWAPPAPVVAALPTVQPAAFEAHVRYLADDRLLGRLPGTPGYQLAVDYVTAQFKQNGVLPAGDQGGYVQKVRLRRAFVEPGATLSYQPTSGGPVALVYGRDFSFYANPIAPVVAAAGGMVFAGYGVSAPELGYDDYAGLDATGKIVVLTLQDMHRFGANEQQYFDDLRTVLETAARHGATGVLLAAHKPGPSLPRLPKGATSALDPAGRVAASRTYVPGSVQVVGQLSAAALHQLFAGAASDTTQALAALRAGKPASQVLPGRLSATCRSRYQDVESYNVVGKIVGSAPKLRDEYVVHSAHLDHLGVGAPINGDSIYNGAHDNATGVASVLEISKLYAGLRQKPRRSVLFVLLTGEEMGLLGSAYFAKLPTVPKTALVAAINTDMPTIIAPLLGVVPLGADHSSLLTEVRQAADYLKLTVELDPEPAQNRFIRSDQYSFVVQGVPALHIKYGNRTADGKNNLSETVQKWRSATYHKPQDNVEGGTFDWAAGAQYARLNFLVGYQVAQATARPSWNKGDFFGVRFGK